MSKRIVYDTNILFPLARIKTKKRQNEVRKIINPNQDVEYFSIVSLAEARVLAKSNGWGKVKMYNLFNLFGSLNLTNIANKEIDAYEEIEMFNLGKHSTLSLGGSDITMGKNDIWIAATAMILNATLVTNDKDFDHLDKALIDVVKVNIPRD